MQVKSSVNEQTSDAKKTFANIETRSFVMLYYFLDFYSLYRAYSPTLSPRAASSVMRAELSSRDRTPYTRTRRVYPPGA